MCSKATDGNKTGSYIEKRVNEIDNVLDQLLDNGIKPKNIFLSGVSAGGWSSLMLMPKVGIKFNSAIVFAPACCGPRHEINKYPVWRKKIRPKQVKQIQEANLINHRKSCTGIRAQDEDKWACSDYGREISKGNFARHRRICNPEAAELEAENRVYRPKYKTCEYCGSVISASNMAKHQRSSKCLGERDPAVL